MVGLNFEHHLSDKDSPKEAEKKKEEALKAIREFASGARIPYPLALVDQKTMNKLGNVGGFPTTFFLDKSGKLRLRVTGAEDFAPLDSIVAELLAEGPRRPRRSPRDSERGRRARRAGFRGRALSASVGGAPPYLLGTYPGGPMIPSIRTGAVALGFLAAFCLGSARQAPSTQGNNSSSSMAETFLVAVEYRTPTKNDQPIPRRGERGRVPRAERQAACGCSPICCLWGFPRTAAARSRPSAWVCW